MEEVLRAELSSEASELLWVAQHEVLAEAMQRVRQALEERPRAQLSNGEPNRGSH